MKWIVPLFIAFLGLLVAGPIGVFVVMVIWGVYALTTRKPSRK